MLKISNEEKIILKNLPKNFKFIARNKGIKNDLYIFEMKPNLNSDGFFNHHSHQMPFNQFRHIFDGIEPGKSYEISQLIGDEVIKPKKIQLSSTYGKLGKMMNEKKGE